MPTRGRFAQRPRQRRRRRALRPARARGRRRARAPLRPRARLRRLPDVRTGRPAPARPVRAPPPRRPRSGRRVRAVGKRPRWRSPSPRRGPAAGAGLPAAIRATTGSVTDPLGLGRPNGVAVHRRAWKRRQVGGGGAGSASTRRSRARSARARPRAASPARGRAAAPRRRRSGLPRRRTVHARSGPRPGGDTQARSERPGGPVFLHGGQRDGHTAYHGTSHECRRAGARR